LRLEITAVSDSTANVGLAEIEVFEVSGDNINRVPVANAGAEQTVSGGDTVYLDGSASRDADGDTLTYQWTQSAGTQVALSDAAAVSPVFTAPDGLTADEVLTFELVVNDGRLDSAASSVSITVQSDLPPSGANIAPDAVATASSEAGTAYAASSAIDGCIDGYPGDSSCEWIANYRATKVGAWLELNWSTPHMVDRAVLYDRPNSNDRITAATITMSDGTSIAVGALNNDGSATEITFTPVEITWLRLTVESVRGNVGLSEIEVFENPNAN
jgi:hypothetical protein